VKRVAVLDDYLGLARELGPWDRIAPPIALEVFTDHLVDEGAIARRLAAFEIVVLNRERTPFPRTLIARLPRLEYLVTFGHRNRSIDLAATRERGIAVSGTDDGIHHVAELAWGLILALARNIVREDRALRGGVWQSALGSTLRGRTLGFLGLGRIGGEIARIGRGFGMATIAWSQNLTPARCAEVGGVRLVARDALFAEADYLVVALVESARTRGLVGARELALMKPAAFLVNVSRAGIVDQAAMLAALAGRRIAGAALDVFDVEPLPADHPLRRLDNVLLTPHIGNFTREMWASRFAQLTENIQEFQNGRIVRPIEG
jgi:phosphoglycerate dehydrogenase-like enzyme